MAFRVRAITASARRAAALAAASALASAPAASSATAPAAVTATAHLAAFSSRAAASALQQQQRQQQRPSSLLPTRRHFSAVPAAANAAAAGDTTTAAADDEDASPTSVSPAAFAASSRGGGRSAALGTSRRRIVSFVSTPPVAVPHPELPRISNSIFALMKQRHSLASLSQPPYVAFFDFNQRSSLTGWRVVDDNDVGGSSTGSFSWGTATNPITGAPMRTLVFQGRLGRLVLTEKDRETVISSTYNSAGGKFRRFMATARSVGLAGSLADRSNGGDGGTATTSADGESEDALHSRRAMLAAHVLAHGGTVAAGAVPASSSAAESAAAAATGTVRRRGRDAASRAAAATAGAGTARETAGIVELTPAQLALLSPEDQAAYIAAARAANVDVSLPTQQQQATETTATQEEHEDDPDPFGGRSGSAAGGGPATTAGAARRQRSEATALAAADAAAAAGNVSTTSAAAPRTSEDLEASRLRLQRASYAADVDSSLHDDDILETMDGFCGIVSPSFDPPVDTGHWDMLNLCLRTDDGPWIASMRPESSNATDLFLAAVAPSLAADGATPAYPRLVVNPAARPFTNTFIRFGDLMASTSGMLRDSSVSVAETPLRGFGLSIRGPPGPFRIEIAWIGALNSQAAGVSVAPEPGTTTVSVPAADAATATTADAADALLLTHARRTAEAEAAALAESRGIETRLPQVTETTTLPSFRRFGQFMRQSRFYTPGAVGTVERGWTPDAARAAAAANATNAAAHAAAHAAAAAAGLPDRTTSARATAAAAAGTRAGAGVTPILGETPLWDFVRGVGRRLSAREAPDQNAGAADSAAFAAAAAAAEAATEGERLAALARARGVVAAAETADAAAAPASAAAAAAKAGRAESAFMLEELFARESGTAVPTAAIPVSSAAAAAAPEGPSLVASVTQTTAESAAAAAATSAAFASVHPAFSGYRPPTLAELQSPTAALDGDAPRPATLTLSPGQFAASAASSHTGQLVLGMLGRQTDAAMAEDEEALLEHRRELRRSFGIDHVVVRVDPRAAVAKAAALRQLTTPPPVITARNADAVFAATGFGRNGERVIGTEETAERVRALVADADDVVTMGLLRHDFHAGSGPNKKEVDVKEGKQAMRKRLGSHGASAMGFPTQQEEDDFMAKAKHHPIVAGSENSDFMRLVFNSRLPSYIVQKESMVLSELRDVTGAATAHSHAVLRAQPEDVQRRFMDEMRRDTQMDTATADGGDGGQKK
jgi:hypothetical protein